MIIIIIKKNLNVAELGQESSDQVNTIQHQKINKNTKSKFSQNRVFADEIAKSYQIPSWRRQTNDTGTSCTKPNSKRATSKHNITAEILKHPVKQKLTNNIKPRVSRT